MKNKKKQKKIIITALCTAGIIIIAFFLTLLFWPMHGRALSTQTSDQITVLLSVNGKEEKYQKYAKLSKDSLTAKMITGKYIASTDQYDFYKWTLDFFDSYETVIGIPVEDKNIEYLDPGKLDLMVIFHKSDS